MLPINFPLLKSPPDPHVQTVASDLEGTLTGGVTVKAIHEYLVLQGRKRESQAVLLQFMPRYAIRKLLRLDLRETKNEWMRALIRRFRGASQDDLRRMADWVVERSIWAGRRVGVIEELQAHLAAGRRVLVVSGMSDPILASLLDRLPGFEAIGTALLPAAGGFSGELDPQFNVGAMKVQRLRPFASPDGKIHSAYGDTIDDLAMLAMSEHPVAVAPDAGLRRLAEGRGWRILEG